jgi:hypothetical protein
VVTLYLAVFWDVMSYIYNFIYVYAHSKGKVRAMKMEAAISLKLLCLSIELNDLTSHDTTITFTEIRLFERDNCKMLVLFL